MPRIHKLRSFRQADSLWYRGLDALCFPVDTPFLNGPQYHWWVMYDEERPIGFAGLYVDGNEAHFCRAGVIAAKRGLNYQRDLIKARIAWCRRHGIKTIRTYTALDNHPSRKNLRACGFRNRKCKDHYSYRLELQR